MKKRIVLAALCLFLALSLSGCALLLQAYHQGGPAAVETPAVTDTPEATATPEPEPTAAAPWPGGSIQLPITP